MKPYPMNHTSTKFKAVFKQTIPNTKEEIWVLKKRIFGLFWKTVRVGSYASIINECKKSNGVTGSSKSPVDDRAIGQSHRDKTAS